MDPDEEPKLKYNRMENDVCNILQIDAVSCICVHTKFICLGTQCGVIYLLDHEGNTVPFRGANNGTVQVTEPQQTLNQLRAHVVAVNTISVDTSGEYLASCSDDGKVLVYGLYSNENTHCLKLNRLVSCVALDPLYYKSGSGRRFVIGDNKLTLSEKTFLSRRDTVIGDAGVEDVVLAVAWRGRFIAWASAPGVRVYDVVARLSLGLIVIPSSSHHRPRLRWADDVTLMIGWGDTVRICLVRRRPGGAAGSGDYLLDPVYSYQTEYHVCGLGPLDDHLVLLGVPKELDPDTGRPQRPVLVVAEYRVDYAEISTDTLNIRGFDAYSTDDYHLDMVPEESRLFVVSPKEIVVASPYSAEERVSWLMEQGRYERALRVVEAGGAGRHTVASVGEQYVEWLLREGRGTEAAALTARVADRPGWERLVRHFSEMHQNRALSQHVPTAPTLALPQYIYERILEEYIRYDADGLLRLVQQWDPVLYRTKVVVNAVLKHLLTTEIDKHVYLEALALLYCHQKEYDKALTTYLTLQHRDVFTLITKHNMYDVIQDKILQLMELDADRAVAILVVSPVPVEVVERQLHGRDALLLKYLDAYSKVHPADRYHGRLVRLYATLAPERLLPFLRSSDQYPIQEALDLCRSRRLYPETVFLLSRIGNSREALQVIIDELHDIERAIHFCQEQNDAELWVELIERAVSNPEHVTLLLRRVGGHVDPSLLLRRVPYRARVPGLQPALTKMMRDHRLQLSVQEACRAITLRNYFEVHAKLVSQRARGHALTDVAACGVCGGRLLSGHQDLVMFSCRHSYHQECLLARRACVLCQPP